MLLIPQKPTTQGLIQKCKMKGKTEASSTNEDENRKDNPINYESGDRWCCAPSGEFDTSWWKVTLDYWIYPTNYSILNSDFNVAPRAWTFQGKKRKNKEWINLSVVEHSTIEANSFGTLPITNDDGPFNTFRFISSLNSLHTGTNYHFCIYKFDIFGFAFRDFCKFSGKVKSYFSYNPSILLFTAILL